MASFSTPQPSTARQRTSAPQAQQGSYDPSGLQAFIQQLAGLGSGYELTDQDIQNLGNFQLMSELQAQQSDAKYKQGYLDFLNNDLGLKQNQIAQAQQQMDFQQGPYWDWYTEQYFPAQQQMSQNQLLMSQEATKQSQFDTTKAKDYALAQAYNTQSARYGADAAKYQMWAQRGFVNPSGPTGY